MIGAEERTKSAELELHQRQQGGDAHDPACDEAGDPGMTIGDGGEKAGRGAGQDCCNDANHSGDADQEIAAFTSSATFFSTTGLHLLSAYVTGHTSPSSRFAVSWKPRVE